MQVFILLGEGGGGGSKFLNFGLLSGKEIPEKENADYELKCEANARAH